MPKMPSEGLMEREYHFELCLIFISPRSCVMCAFPFCFSDAAVGKECELRCPMVAAGTEVVLVVVAVTVAARVPGELRGSES